MRLVTLYRHGVTMGTPPTNPNKSPAKRGEVSGWTTATSRRNTRFLYSVDENRILATEDGEPLTPLAVTLTLKDCPESHTEWERIRRAYFDRLRRLGLYRSHWLTEWQRRGVPHMHCCLFFPEVKPGIEHASLVSAVRDAWLDLTRHLGSQKRSQHITPIYDPIGWFHYQSKHAARGVHHYQRSSENMPEQWKKTGRLWGKTGDWPTEEPDKILMTDETFFRYRRLVRAWRKADARTAQNRRRIHHARIMLRNNHPEQSKLRGVSEWIGKDQSIPLLLIARSNSALPEDLHQ